MKNNKSFPIKIIYFFSFTLAFGKINNTLLDGYWFDALTAITCFISFYYYWPKVNKRYILKFIKPLLAMMLIMFMMGLFQGDFYFNIKFLAAIGVYTALLSFVVIYPKESLKAILYYSLGVALLVVLYYLGVFEDNVQFSKGRIFLFEENPNSISSRVSIALVYLFYIVIDNPLKIDKKRFLFLIPLPFMLAFIFLTGSKGSTIVAFLGLYVVFIYSTIRFSTKLLLSVIVGLVIVTFGINYFINSTVYERFGDSPLELGSRGVIWRNALDIFLNNPLGIGENAYFRAMQSSIGMAIDTHNLFLYIMVTGGFIGLILFMIFLLRIFKLIWQQLKIRQIITPTLFLIILLLMFKTGGVLTYLVMWYILAFITGFQISLKNYE